eukprot:50835_1
MGNVIQVIEGPRTRSSNRRSHHMKTKTDQKKPNPSNDICAKLTSDLKEVHFKIHIALDFGTDGCALAFAYDGQVTVYNKWKTKKRKRAIKAKSQILLSDKDEVVAFGDHAKIIYSSLSGAEKNKWKFFDKFKMELYGVSFLYIFLLHTGADVDEKSDIVESKSGNDLEDMYLTSMNGQTCRASIVFVKAFQHLQNIAMEYMHKITNEDIKSQEIQWIVTVPSIWSERAKSKMETWIINAELVDPMIKDQCLIVYEPDCAALSIFEQMKDRKIRKEFDRVELVNAGTNPMIKDTGIGNESHQGNVTQISRDIVYSIVDNVTSNSTDMGKRKHDVTIGDKYILIDAGGGTVD